jgi:tetratricopeptide (TPR) repeat protein
MKWHDFLIFAVIWACTTEKTLHKGSAIESVSAIKEPVENGSSNPDLWSREKRESFASLYFMVGEYKQLDGDFLGAKRNFEVSYDMAPNSYTGAKVMIASLDSKESSGDTLLEARRMVLLYPKSEVLRTIYARVLFTNKMPEKAVSELEKAIELDPTKERAYLLLIEYLEASKNRKKSLHWARKFSEAIPSSQLAVFIYAKILVADRQYKKALVETTKGLELDDNNPEFLGLHGYCLEANNQTAKAISIFEEMFRQSRPDSDMARKLMDLYRETDGLQRANRLFDKLSASSKEPVHSIEIQRAYIKVELGKQDEAILVLQNAKKSFPESDLIHLLLGINYYLQGKKDLAFESYRQIRISSKYYLMAIELQIDGFLESGAFQDIVNLVESMDKSITPTSRISAAYASAFSRLGDSEKSVEILDAAIKREPEEAQLYFLKAVYLEKLGDIADCVEALRNVIRLDSSHHPALNFLAFLFADRDENLPEAESLIIKALKLKPDDPFYLDTLGWVYSRLGKFEEAEKILTPLVAKNLGEIVIAEHLAEVKWKIGKKADAIKIYESIQPSLKNDKDSERIKKRYQDLLREIK